MGSLTTTALNSQTFYLIFQKEEKSSTSCSAGKKKVLECYKKNPKQILLCAGEVNEFANCVHNERIS